MYQSTPVLYVITRARGRLRKVCGRPCLRALGLDRSSDWAHTEVMHEPQMVLSDDGTLDTVIECAVCHREYRFNYDGEECHRDPEECYQEFVDYAIAEATAEHGEDLQS